jgi:ATP-dependent DNA ligase
MARGQLDGATAFAAFDVLKLGGQNVMADPWVDRRKRLKDLLADEIGGPWIQLVPTGDDARRLWAASV